jgi:hypothetical protein
MEAEKMNTAIKILSASFACATILVAFIQWNINPGEWSMQARVGAVILFCVINMLAFLAQIAKHDDEEASHS